MKVIYKITYRKEILWESETASDREVDEKEREFIRALKSNDPAIGYNQRPKIIVSRPAGSADEERVS